MSNETPWGTAAKTNRAKINRLSDASPDSSDSRRGDRRQQYGEEQPHQEPMGEPPEIALAVNRAYFASKRAVLGHLERSLDRLEFLTEHGVTTFDLNYPLSYRR